MANLLPSLIYGTMLGMMYGGIALGISLIFGVLRLSNFAQGSFLMTACFLFYIGEVYLGISAYISVFVILPFMFCLGYGIQMLLINRLLRRERATVANPISAMLITLGIWMVLENLFMMIFGAEFRSLSTKFGIHQTRLGGVAIPTAQIIGFVGTILLTVGIVWLLRKTEMGKRIRSVSQNRDSAALCGVDVYKTYAITFGIGLVLVSISGFLLVQYFPLWPMMGSVFGIKSIMIVVLGGLGSIPGAILGGILFGVVESVGAQFMPSSAAVMLTFIMFILILLFKPRGLLGKIQV